MPVLTSLSPTSGPRSGGNSVVLTGSGFSGVGPLSVLFGTTATTFTINSDTQITAIAPSGTGTQQVTVVALLDGTSNGLPYTYGPAAPTLTSISPAQGPTTGGNTVTLTGTGSTGTTAVHFGAAAATSVVVVSDTQVTAVAPPGSGIVQVTATTAGGTSNPVSYIYVIVPTLTSLSPSSGPASGLNTVTITGSGFTGPLTVRFGSTATTFTIISSTQIQAVVPPGTGTVQVTVTGSGGSSSGLPYRYAPVPSLTSISPIQGPAAGGNTVTSTGTGLTGTTSVHFGATAAASFTVVSDTQVTAVAPPGTGTVQVTATTPGGTTNAVSYTYVTAPTLTTVTPNQGPASGGTTVTLTGTNLSGATAVDFGAAPATSFTVVSDTEVSAVAPAGTAGPVAVTITTPGGTSAGVLYSYVAAPTLTTISPSNGSTGTEVTLTGTGLSNPVGVSFGGIPAESFQGVSGTQITAVAPPGTGAVPVTVTTIGGTSNSVSFTYNSTFYITDLPVGAVVALPSTGGTLAILTTGLDEPWSIALSGDTLYIANTFAGTVLSLPVTGGTPTVLSEGLASYGIAVSGDLLYITDYYAGTVVSLPVTGGTPTTLASGLPGPEGIAVSGDTLYITEWDTGDVVSLPITGGTLTTLATGLDRPEGIAVSGDTLYIANGGAGTVVSLPVTGGPFTTLAEGLPLPAGIAVSGDTLYVTEVDGDAVVSLPVTGGTPTTVVEGLPGPAGIALGPSRPLLSFLDPDFGPVAGGNPVVINGSGFSNAGPLSVFFGNTQTTFNIDSDSQITALAPPGIGTVEVRVVASLRGASNSLPYVYVGAPALTSVSPNQGPSQGGNTVTLTGTDLLGATVVSFGATAAPSFTVDSDTQITATAPAGSGIVDVTVTTPGGTSTSVPYTYL